MHQLAAAALPTGIAVPRVELMGEPTEEFPYRFAGHRFIVGNAVDALDHRVLPVLARDISVAFGAIHAIPEKSAREAGVREIDMDDLGRKEWFERGVALASELHGLDPVVDDALTWMSKQSLPLPRYDGPLYFIHHDMGPEHVIADPATGHLVGILDWTDASLGDPARDFVGLVPSLGWDFTDEALRSYPLAVDLDFRERLGFLARLLSVIWLTEAHEQRGDVAKHIQWVRHAFANGLDNFTPTRRTPL